METNLYIEHWPPVDISHLSDIKKRKFNLRKKALIMLLEGTMSLKQIKASCHISIPEMFRIKTRALSIAPDGSPYGYLACIPNFRIKTYTRSKDGGVGTAGLFTQFLDKNPVLKNHLDDLALGKRSINGSKIYGKFYKGIWREFRRHCIEQGFDVECEYPFNSTDGGREAIRNYCKKIRQHEYIRGTLVELGSSTAFLLAQSKKTIVGNENFSLRPYELVQVDGHKIDGAFVIEIETINGEIVEKPLSRIWLIIAIDCASRAVLGYSISLSSNYTNEDVCECIASIFIPWEPKSLETSGILYRSGAGLPSGIIDECSWRCFDSLRFDNAYAHLSKWTQNKLIEVGVNEVILNRPRRPRTNAIVERFNNTLEETAFHQMPNTYGSSPSDPRRNNPEDAAEKLIINYRHLENIADIVIANYNATPHTSLFGKSPLESIKYGLENKIDIPRHLSKEHKQNLPLFDIAFTVTIAGRKSGGHRPYIQFKQGKYRSELLSDSFDLIGKKAILKLNIKDIRKGKLFLENGRYLGEVVVEQRWNYFKHSLATRVAINKLIKENRLASDSHDPIRNYMEYIIKEAQEKRKARNILQNITNTTETISEVKVSKSNGKEIYHDSDWINLV